MEKKKGPPKRISNIYPLTPKYRIRTDEYNLMLERKTEKAWTVLGYHSKLKSLLAKLYELEIKENINDLNQMVELKDKLIELVEKIMGDFEIPKP